jgi:hypothetical protein
MNEVAAPPAEGDLRPAEGWRAAIGLWWGRLVADQAREKVCGIIHQRQYELDSLITEARSGLSPADRPGALADRIARAETLVKEPVPKDRAAANELLDKLDFILPLLADEDRLRLMLAIELDRDRHLLGPAGRQRASQLLKSSERSAESRHELELLTTTAVRERDDLLRELAFTSDLRQNYLTWLAIALVLLLAGVAVTATLSASFGLWADVLLAILAGALGGTLSGVIRLRAPERRLASLKNLGLVMLVQPLVGAVGGIVLFALWRSGAFTIAGLSKNEWASVAVVAFAGGFSERLFLRSIGRIGGAESIDKPSQPAS